MPPAKKTTKKPAAYKATQSFATGRRVLKKDAIYPAGRFDNEAALVKAGLLVAYDPAKEKGPVESATAKPGAKRKTTRS